MQLADFTTIQQDNAIAAFMDYLYASSGRESMLYTGLWDEFIESSGGLETAKRLRDEWMVAFLSDALA